ncbi:unnamed protein product [Bursaphelenchus okinawaensis]|uniref:protein-serine/threonine phosphatase n=1 Tax=Bursaphelenchus okinawaensis TaxID=465554 RepID=A0A811L9I2_9BILA|nr:unnamed protein product [Bursaphelenchus okinawaensis]CAG9121549.1 unnamed protein product [Bursaphelenchus okinawaensis]
MVVKFDRLNLFPLSRIEVLESLEGLSSYIKGRRKKSLLKFIDKNLLARVIFHAAAIFAEEPVLIEVPIPTNAPVYIAGNLHGRPSQMLRWFELNNPPPQSVHVFIGGYIEYGRHGIDVLILLFLYKIAFPKHIFMVRGMYEYYNFECRIFREECNKIGKNLLEIFHLAFNEMSWAVKLIPHSGANGIFCAHGGVSEWFIVKPEVLENVRKNNGYYKLYEKLVFTDIMFGRPIKETPADSIQALARIRHSRFFDKKQLLQGLVSINCTLLIRARSLSDTLWKKKLNANEKMNENHYADVDSSACSKSGLAEVIEVRMAEGWTTPRVEFIVTTKMKKVEKILLDELLSQLNKDLTRHPPAIYPLPGQMQAIWNKINQNVVFPRMWYDHSSLAELLQIFPNCPLTEIEPSGPPHGLVMLYWLLIYALYPTEIDVKDCEFLKTFERRKSEWYSPQLLQFGEEMRQIIDEFPDFIDQYLRFKEEKERLERKAEQL